MDVPADPYECAKCVYRQRVLYPCIAHLAATGLEKIHHPEELRQAMLNRNRPDRVMPPDDVVPRIDAFFKEVAPARQTPTKPDRYPDNRVTRRVEFDL